MGLLRGVLLALHIFGLLSIPVGGINLLQISSGTFSVRSKTLFRVVHDTTCGDCHEWFLEQLKPAWEDSEFHDFLNNTFKIEIIGMSVTRHSQGLEMNRNLNYAFSVLDLEEFVNRLMCWESNILAWVEGADGEWHEANVDIEKNATACELPLCPGGYQGKVCADIGASLSEELKDEHPNEVPWLEVGSDVQPPHSVAFTDFRRFLCEQGMAQESPEKCKNHTI